MARPRLPTRHSAALVTLLVVSTSVAACRGPWILVVVSEASAPVVVRISAGDLIEDRALAPNDAGQIVQLPSPPGSGRLLALDPKTCATLASAPLIGDTAWANLQDDGDVTHAALVINAKSIQPDEFAALPISTQCAGRGEH